MLPSRAAPVWYLWQVSGKHVSVDLNLDVVDRIGAVRMCASLESRSGAAVIDGLLLGRTGRDSGSIVVEIDDCEPLEHGFPISHIERRAVQRRLRETTAKPQSSIVGFYRI